MQVNSKKLEEILVKPGFISENDFSESLKEAKETEKELEEVLILKE